MNQSGHLRIDILVLSVAALLGTAARASVTDGGSAWNDSPEPAALYGHCGQGAPSAMGSKLGLVVDAGHPVPGVMAVRVLHCGGVNGGGGTRTVPCPAGFAYDFCLRNNNDGRGNSVTLGVLEAGPRTDPNAAYDGCPAGADLRNKLDVLVEAGFDPRTIAGIATLDCAAAQPARARPAARAACPWSTNPFAYCVSTPDDGHGNAVTLGVLRAFGAGDPAGLYGECDSDVLPGFVPKASLLALVGRSADNVRTIDLLTCQIPGGFGGGFPGELHTGSCASGAPWVSPALAGRYDYCVWGTDPRGIGVVLGVSGS